MYVTDISLPEQIGGPDDGQVPGVHVGLWRIGGHPDEMAHQKLQSPDREEVKSQKVSNRAGEWKTKNKHSESVDKSHYYYNNQKRYHTSLLRTILDIYCVFFLSCATQTDRIFSTQPFPTWVPGDKPLHSTYSGSWQTLNSVLFILNEMDQQN